MDEDNFDAPPLPELPLGAISHPYFGMLGEQVPEGTKAKAGAKLQPNQSPADKDKVLDALRTVYDPEIPVNIYDLGLIYDCQIDDKTGDCNITMSLTAPACPVAGEMPQQVADAVAGVDGVGQVEVTLTWSPPWDKSMMSEDARMALDIW